MNIERENALRRLWGELINNLREGRHEREALACAEQAVGMRLWNDPLQRPSDFYSYIPAIPVHDSSNFLVCTVLRK